MNKQLNFSYLFKQALVEWPEKLELGELQYVSSNLSRYAVKGLGNLCDEINEKHIGTNDEIIIRGLHDSIEIIVHATAKFVCEIKMSSIRAEAVRLVFEQRLNEAASMSGLNWTSDDYALVKLYFSQNP